MRHRKDLKLLMAANDISEHAIGLIKGVHNKLNYHYKRSAHLVNMNKNQLSQRSKNASNQQVFANVAYNAKPLIQKERDRVNNMKQDSIAAYRIKLQKSQQNRMKQHTATAKKLKKYDEFADIAFGKSRTEFDTIRR
eukprot:975554_1